MRAGHSCTIIMQVQQYRPWPAIPHSNTERLIAANKGKPTGETCDWGRSKLSFLAAAVQVHAIQEGSQSEARASRMTCYLSASICVTRDRPLPSSTVELA